ncbi:unnamed protein product [Dracunculus medinensis]|uniref:Calmodulin n=1 Tax=Dracunculus medinensis TaxID=318479 RepID=A0A0N4UHA7_DRAME|nr:unnamed protein product [Dracunculus medinensis]
MSKFRYEKLKGSLEVDLYWNTKLCEIFASIDSDNDGYLGRNEIAALLRTINAETTPLDIDAVFREMDENHCGIVNKEDFIRYMSTPPTQHLSTVELEKLFRLFDNDGDGAITKEELKEIVSQTTPWSNEKLIAEMFEKNDTNKDGRITFVEFMHLMNDYE